MLEYPNMWNVDLELFEVGVQPKYWNELIITNVIAYWMGLLGDGLIDFLTDYLIETAPEI